MILSYRWRRILGIGAVATVVAAAIVGAATLFGEPSPHRGSPIAGAPADLSVKMAEPTPSTDPLRTFRPNVAVMFTCVNGKPDLRAWSLVGSQDSDVAQAVKLGAPQSLDGTCTVLFSPVANAHYLWFERPSLGADYHVDHEDWGWVKTIQQSPYSEALNANDRGRAVLLLFYTVSLAPGPALNPVMSPRSNDIVYRPPLGIPAPPARS